jgi:hypothetical protein
LTPRLAFHYDYKETTYLLQFPHSRDPLATSPGVISSNNSPRKAQDSKTDSLLLNSLCIKQKANGKQ